MIAPYQMPVTGTDIWYYFICKRESWLMSHEITPDEDDENIDIGRFLHEYRYGREKKKEIAIGSIKIDQLKTVKGKLVVQEVKKSSRFKESARYQLLFYLDILKQMGIEARGELLFPEERARESVEWTPSAKEELDRAVEDIRRIARQPVPPPPKKIGFCKKCGYRE